MNRLLRSRLRSLPSVLGRSIVRPLAAALMLALAVAPAGAQEAAGVQVRKPRLMLVPESTVNQTSAQQYAQLMRQASAKGVLNRPPEAVERVRAVAARLIPQGSRFSAEAQKWRWEVNVIDAGAVNAFCMPGGKIVVFTGLINRLKLNDDELAAIVGHEIAHALLEHGRARMSQALLQNVGINFAAAYFGLSGIGASALAQAAEVAITLPYSRGHETDADLVGIELAARAGYDPRAAVEVWRKMAALGGGSQPPQFLSTHPGHEQRMRAIEEALPRVMPLYEAARRTRLQ